MSQSPRERVNPFNSRLGGPLLIVAVLAGWLFSIVAAFYFFSKR